MSRRSSSGLCAGPPNDRGLAGAMLVDERAHLIDRADAVEVALALRGAPGKEPMAAEDQPVRARVVPDRRFDEQRELEAGPLPRHPDDAPAEPAIEFLELLFAVCRCGQRDGPVGMQMIDVRRGEKRVQRRIDRRGDAVLAECGGRVVLHHLVFEGFAAIARLELFQLVEIEQREPRVGDRAEIAAAAFHREHADRRTRERIGQIDLRARVAAAEVRDAQVARRGDWSDSEAATAGLPASRSAVALVPEIVQMFQGCRVRHRGVRNTAESAWLPGSRRPRRAA